MKKKWEKRTKKYDKNIIWFYDTKISFVFIKIYTVFSIRLFKYYISKRIYKPPCIGIRYFDVNAMISYNILLEYHKAKKQAKKSMHLVSLFLSRLSPPNKSHRARHRYQNPRHWKSRIRCQLQHRCALHQDVQSLYASFCWISKQVGMAIHTWHHRSHQIRIFRARGSNRSARQPSNGRHCHDRERWKFPAQHWWLAKHRIWNKTNEIIHDHHGTIIATRLPFVVAWRVCFQMRPVWQAIVAPVCFAWSLVGCCVAFHKYEAQWLLIILVLLSLNLKNEKHLWMEEDDNPSCIAIFIKPLQRNDGSLARKWFLCRWGS